MEAEGSGLLDVAGADRYLGVTVAFVRRLVLERRVRYFKLGKFVRFRVADLDALVEAGRREPVATWVPHPVNTTARNNEGCGGADEPTPAVRRVGLPAWTALTPLMMPDQMLVSRRATVCAGVRASERTKPAEASRRAAWSRVAPMQLVPFDDPSGSLPYGVRLQVGLGGSVPEADR